MPVLMRRPEMTLSGYGPTPACSAPLKSATRAKPWLTAASMNELSEGVISSGLRVRMGSGPERPRYRTSPSGELSTALYEASTSSKDQP